MSAQLQLLLLGALLTCRFLIDSQLPALGINASESWGTGQSAEQC